MADATQVDMNDDGEAMCRARRMIEQPSPIAGTPREAKAAPVKAPTPPATEINMDDPMWLRKHGEEVRLDREARAKAATDEVEKRQAAGVQRSESKPIVHQ